MLLPLHRKKMRMRAEMNSFPVGRQAGRFHTHFNS